MSGAYRMCGTTGTLRRDEVAHTEHEPDVGGRRTEVAEEEREERAEKAEPDAPQDLGAGEGRGFFTEA